MQKSSNDAAVSGVKKQTRLGLEAKKSENLSEWYTQVLYSDKFLIFKFFC